VTPNGELKVGGKYRDEDKTNDVANRRFKAADDPTFLMSQGLASLDISSFYFGRYPQGPNASLDAATNFFDANRGAFREDPNAEHADNDPNNYDVKEKVAALYAKNTNRFGRVRLEEGVRVEHTSGTYDGFAIQTGRRRQLALDVAQQPNQDLH